MSTLNEDLVCTKSIYYFEKGQRYKFRFDRFDDPDCIYIFYKESFVNLGKFFSIYKHTYSYTNYFITLTEYRKLKLKKLKEYEENTCNDNTRSEFSLY
jgi:hypothetical protein